MDYQSFNDCVSGHVGNNKIISIPGLGVVGPFQVLRATRCIPGNVVHIPWPKEIIEDGHVVFATIWGNDVDHCDNNVVDSDHINEKGWIECSSSFQFRGGPCRSLLEDWGTVNHL